MKQCPNCQITYADDSLQFCLQDGTPLVGFSNQNSSANYDTESETLVVPKQVEPIRFEPPSSYPNNQTGWQPSQPVIAEQRGTRKPNTPLIVALSVLGTILLLGLGGLGAWLYFNNKKTEVAANVNAVPSNRSTNSANNQNANLTTPSPTPSPTPQPTLRPEDEKAIARDVKDVVDDWKTASEDLDLDAHISQYAETVDYYKAGRVDVARVRSDRQSAFNAYDSIIITIDNLKVTPDASGDKATAVFDKEWNFEGENKYSSGRVQQQLTLAKINGRWRITGEKDLKVYYVEK
jgi:ketosteroid isomerase-like protein